MRTFQIIKQGLCACVLSILLCSCGGGTSSTSAGGEFDSGFAKSSLLASLSNQDATKLCQRAVEFVDSSLTLENICKFEAYVQGANANPSSELVCNDTLSQCLSVIADGEGEFETSTEFAGLDCDATPPRTVNCTATVGLYESCWEETVDQFNDLLDQADCRALDKEVADDIYAAFRSHTPVTPSCQELYQICPNIFVE